MPYQMPVARWFVLLLLPVPFWFALHRGTSGPPHLSEFSLVPLLYAAIAGLFFHQVTPWIFRIDRKAAAVDHLSRLIAGAVLASASVHIVSWLADSGVSGPGIAGTIVSAIGTSRAALSDSALPLTATVLAYAIGVGFVEEASKVLAANPDPDANIRERTAAGFITGIGFGLAEAVMYAFRNYNGHSDWVAYLVRFTFCAGMHGCLTAFAILLLAEAPELEDVRTEWIIRGALLIPVSMLHGLFDALLERNQAHEALLVSFAICAVTATTLWMSESREEDGCYG